MLIACSAFHGELSTNEKAKLRTMIFQYCLHEQYSKILVQLRAGQSSACFGLVFVSLICNDLIVRNYFWRCTNLKCLPIWTVLNAMDSSSSSKMFYTFCYAILVTILLHSVYGATNSKVSLLEMLFLLWYLFDAFNFVY